jgi:hypothetical protein
LPRSLTTLTSLLHGNNRADAILLATHSQGSVVTTQLIDRLISEGHIRTGKNPEAAARVARHAGVVPPVNPHRVCCLALCGIHLGPLYYLNTSSLVQPYIQYFENAAARELFEFQVSPSRDNCFSAILTFRFPGSGYGERRLEEVRRCSTEGSQARNEVCIHCKLERSSGSGTYHILYPPFSRLFLKR